MFGGLSFSYPTKQVHFFFSLKPQLWIFWILGLLELIFLENPTAQMLPYII